MDQLVAPMAFKIPIIFVFSRINTNKEVTILIKDTIIIKVIITAMFISKKPSQLKISGFISLIFLLSKSNGMVL